MGRKEKMACQWNYLRVKREKQTIFLVCEMTETVDAAKAKLCQIIASSGGGEQQPENIKLILKEDMSDLEDGKTLADCKCEPSKCLYMVYKKPDTEDEWEEPTKDEVGAPAS